MLDKKEKERIFYAKSKFYNKDKHFFQKKKLDIDFGNGFGLKVLCIAIFLFLIISSFSMTATDENYSSIPQTQEQQDYSNENTENSGENNSKLTDTGYKSIQVSYTPTGSLYNTLSAIGQQEQDLIVFFKKSKKEQDNSKLFAIFLDNVNKTRKYFSDNYYNSDKSLDEQGIITATNVSDANPNPSQITSPPINTLKLGFRGCMGLTINYDYVLEVYTPYLPKDWREYFELSKQQDKDLQIADYNDDAKSLIRAYSKWAKKWQVFTKNHPDFHMNGDINKMVLEYKEYVNNHH